MTITTFRTPLAGSTKNGHSTMYPAPHAKDKPEPLPTLLIADDDPVVRSALGMTLERRFNIVAVAGDGEQAVARAQATAPDAAIIDVDMPGGGGPRAVRGIVEVSPQTAIVVLSGDESDGIVRDLLQAGAITYCRKGIEPAHLVDTLDRSILAHRQANAAAQTAA
jgi:DNA-binding NarL/FixJ family response regulator